MFLYSLTLSQATAINHSVYGSFTQANQHEIVLSKGKIIELLRPDDQTGQLQVIFRSEAFGIIRAIDSFRLIGMQKDFLVIGSDSGRVVILDYDLENKCFVKIHQETFGKTGARRIVPGEYVASDPKGRAIMIGAVEKQKFVYIMNRDSQNQLTISSPLEAHKAHVITLAMVGLDVGIENPQFACLEIDYGDPEQSFSAVNTGNAQKTLTIYEMDLGLNHVVRKNIMPVEKTAHMLIAVPDSPGGTIVVCEDFLVYKRVDHEERKCYFPQRHDLTLNKTRRLFITCQATFNHDGKFFFILQSEYGDLFKVTLETTDAKVHSITIRYFDTLAPGISINILKTGYLFHAAEASNHGIYLFKSDGEDDPKPTLAHSQHTEKYDKNPRLIPQFNPRAECQNLELRDQIENYAPINEMKVDDLNSEGSQQIYMACGRGAQGTIRALRHGLQVTEMAVSPMPGRPLSVITLKQSLNDAVHRYLLVSFPESTLVLQVLEDKVTQLQNSGFQTTEPTLHAGNLQSDIHVQVTSKSLIQITTDRKRTKWESDKRILLACSNQRQVVIYIEGGQLVYFELDTLSGQLQESQTKIFETEIRCLDIGEVAEGRVRAKFLAVGYADNTCKILSLDQDSCLHRVSIQALPSAPESVCLMQSVANDELFLHVGLDNGVLVRSLVDNITGSISDSRSQFLGVRAVKLTKVVIGKESQDAVIALSNRTFLCYTHMGKYMVSPLSYDSLSHATTFCSERCTVNGFVAIADNSLRIIQVERLGDMFTSRVLQTRYTPVKLLVHPETNYLITLERDHNQESISTLEDQRLKIYNATKDEAFFKAPWHKIGAYPRANTNQFASCIRIVDPYTMQTVSVLEFENGETCFSYYISTDIQSNAGQTETYLFAGIGLEAKLSPRTCSLGFIKTYRFVQEGKSLELVHSTPCEDIPGAFGEIKGRLLAGIGPILRVYDLGQKKLLRKHENKNFVAPISHIQAFQDRIFASDVSESVHVLKYKPDENQLYIFADDVLKRFTNSFCMLDEDTVAAVDKFENLYVIRVPPGVEEDAEDDPTASRFKWENGLFNGASAKMDQICQYFMGECGTSIQKITPSCGTELVYCASTMGSITAFLPFETKEELDFFTHLEMYLRIESQPLSGRDHVMFRSSYAPVKDVIDGDLCELFPTLDLSKQRVLAEELNRNPNEVNKKLEQARLKLL